MFSLVLDYPIKANDSNNNSTGLFSRTVRRQYPKGTKQNRFMKMVTQVLLIKQDYNSEHGHHNLVMNHDHIEIAKKLYIPQMISNTLYYFLQMVPIHLSERFFCDYILISRQRLTILISGTGNKEKLLWLAGDIIWPRRLLPI